MENIVGALNFDHISLGIADVLLCKRLR